MQRSAALALRRRAESILGRLRGRQDLAQLVSDGLELGRSVFIAADAYIDPGHPWLITIGDETTLSPGVMILAHDASMRRALGHTLVARVDIGERVFVGARSILLPGTTVGDDVIIGAGSVLRGTFGPGTVIVGNPARVLNDMSTFVDKHRRALRVSPTWPHRGWMNGRGITPSRRIEQRNALSNRRRGYLIGGEVDGSANDTNAGEP